MNIADYLIHSGKTQQQFADRVGVSQGMVSQWVNGAPVHQRNWPAIMRESEGLITAADLCPDIFGPPTTDKREAA